MVAGQHDPRARKARERAEQAADDRVGDGLLIEYVTGDQHRVNVAGGRFTGNPAHRFETCFGQMRGFFGVELAELRTDLPVCGVQESGHGVSVLLMDGGCYRERATNHVPGCARPRGERSQAEKQAQGTGAAQIHYPINRSRSMSHGACFGNAFPLSAFRSGLNLMAGHNWLDLRQDKSTEIETLRAHFEGHAYDPHWHDSYLLGFTEHGVQQFECRRTRVHSMPGQVFMLEPGDVHDGHAPSEGGFTYSMLYLKPDWLAREFRAWSSDAPAAGHMSFPATLVDDVALVTSISTLFDVLREQEMRVVRQAAIDGLFAHLSRHLDWRVGREHELTLPAVAQRAREYLHAHVEEDIGLDDLAASCEVDRFRLTRAFKASFGLAPHAYLIQLRLARARQLLAAGALPADVAHTLCFADQSHLGRWFRRAYGLTPSHYGKRCTNLPD